MGSAADVEAEVERLVALAAAEHPGVVEPQGLRAQLAARITGGAPDLAARAPDMLLAAACVAGDRRAIEILDARLPAIVRPALARLGGAGVDEDEIVQRVRVALLAHDGGHPGLAGYSGRGELRAYVRAIAVRLALRRVQRETQPGDSDPGEVFALLPDAHDSPELAVLKQQYRSELREAFAAAVTALEPRDRTLLRQHYVDGLSLDGLASLHDVHRSTCARWLESARTTILHAIRRHLRAQLGLDSTELERAVALVSSQLDLSLSRHLASIDEVPGG
jgi:RNA polymerase sigma-70 factor (ECF subfamily)